MVFLLYVLTGIFAGTVAGLLGVGGGVIVVPALVFIFSHFYHNTENIVFHLAAGTSLAVMIVTAGSAAWGRYRLGHIDWLIFKRMALGLALGVIAGALLANVMPSHVLKHIFSVFVLSIALRLLLLKQAKPHRRLPAKHLLSIISAAIGLLSGLLGIGVGSVVVPFLMFCNVNMRYAAGTATVCTVMTAIIGTISFMLIGHAHHIHLLHSSGYIYWPAFFAIAIPSVIFAHLAAAWSTKLDTDWLKRIFGIFLLLVCVSLVV